ncbi:uncharacterized protein LOC115879976 [Sitophilus oryzae]|uniref:Uncharacterized protein LOC115879976 n=1 Tax=Sitophilus oryzae TaxID=7048 RepID=A0A6J2XQG9_SITOR|nr:uncharacterized protein LOC115879976 [Sitophilus oryzae]
MKVLVLFCALVLVTSSRAEGPSGLAVISKVIRQYINSQPEDVRLGDGVHIISTRSENDARANVDDGTLLGTVENYLENHEVRIKLPELLPGEGFGRALKIAVDEAQSKEDKSTGRGKKGGGGGGAGIAVMGLMMGKMMAALGLGGVGMLAMKALMVSALALMLSVIVGLKKLTHHDDDGGHHVIHASSGHEHYRRRREAADMAYRAYQAYNTR